MPRVAATASETAATSLLRVPAGTDLVEWYFERGWTDGLPVVPPTRERIDEFVAALGGAPDFVECKVPPRRGSLSREILAINMAMAGCKPEYAPVVRAAIRALTVALARLPEPKALQPPFMPIAPATAPLTINSGAAMCVVACTPLRLKAFLVSARIAARTTGAYAG